MLPLSSIVTVFAILAVYVFILFRFIPSVRNPIWSKGWHSIICNSGMWNRINRNVSQMLFGKNEKGRKKIK